MIIYIIIEFPNIYCIITVLLSTESFVEKKMFRKFSILAPKGMVMV